jgi:F-type H+-transporting ATPase subunit delta
MDPVAVDRYARALFNASQKAGETAAVEADLKTLQAESRRTGLKSFLDNPRFPRKLKLEVIERVGAMCGSKLTVSFLRVLLIKSRAYLMERIVDRFVELHREFKGIVPCRLVLASEPSKEFLNRIEKELERITHLDVELNVQVDPAALGGVRLTIKNRVLDGTYAERLEDLKERLLAGQYT